MAVVVAVVEEEEWLVVLLKAGVRVELEVELELGRGMAKALRPGVRDWRDMRVMESQEEGGDKGKRAGKG